MCDRCAARLFVLRLSRAGRRDDETPARPPEEGERRVIRQRRLNNAARILSLYPLISFDPMIKVVAQLVSWGRRSLKLSSLKADWSIWSSSGAAGCCRSIPC